jgi:hypothetical protein
MAVLKRNSKLEVGQGNKNSTVVLLLLQFYGDSSLEWSSLGFKVIMKLTIEVDIASVVPAVVVSLSLFCPLGVTRCRP